MNILVLPGDGIGPEVTTEAVRVLRAVDQRFGLGVELQTGLIGGAAIDAHGTPLPDETLAMAEPALAKEWLNEEEDAAWAHLQQEA